MSKTTVCLNVAVTPPGFDKPQKPGAIIELDSELAEKYIAAKYAFKPEPGARPTANVASMAPKNEPIEI